MRPTRLATLSVLAFALTACGGSGRGPAAVRNNADLAALVISAGTLTPAFSPTVFVYTAAVASTVDKVTFTPTAAIGTSTLAINGQPVASGSASAAQGLVEGSNAIAISVTAADAATVKTYTVTVTRFQAPVLSALSLSAGALTPAFAANTTSYAATAGFVARSVTLTATTTLVGSTLTVNGVAINSGEASALLELIEGLNNLVVRVTTAEGETRDYTVAVTRQALAEFAQQAYAKASNTGADDRFGATVALSGDTLAVAANLEDSNATGVNGDDTNNDASSSGAVYVFTRSGTTWTQQAYVKASNTGVGDQFGFSVALSGDTLAVGAYLEDSSATGVQGDQTNNDALESGAVYVFTRSGTTWTQEAYVKASNTEAGDRFGYSVGLSGDTLAVSAYVEDSNATGVNGVETNNDALGSGAVYVFTRSGTTWTQQAYVKASNTGVGDQFGYSVALSGDTLAVGARREDSNATGINGDQTNNDAGDAGAAYVFTRSGTTWLQEAYVKASNTGADDEFGVSVALSGDTLAVAANFEDSSATGVQGDQTNNDALQSGAVYVFTRSGTTWTQQAYVKASNTGVGDQFGYSVTLSGDTLAVGAWLEDSNATGVNGDQTNNDAPSSGAVYVFIRSGTTWTQGAYVKASNTEAGDRFGYSVALSGDTLAVGAYLEDSNATGVNGDETNNDALMSGAVYVRR